MTVIKRTRLKFFVVMAAIIVTIVLVFCIGILVPTHVRNKASVNTTLDRMISNFDRTLPSDLPAVPDTNIPFDIDRFNDMRGFTVKLNSKFEIIEIKNSDNSYSEETITQYVASIIKSGKASGKIGDLEYLLRDTQNGKILACLDVSIEDSIFKELFRTVLFVGGGGILLLLVLVWFLSYWIIKPTAEALIKQKRFISEAGHELKTPLSVISASVELLQKNNDGTNSEKWLEIIKQQTDKMSVMTTELLTLSKLDETEAVIKTEFDLSQTVLTEALAFEGVAFESGKKLICDTDNGLIYRGDAGAVRQAVGILCDNAVKYSEPGCEITVRLKKQAAKIILSVSNAENSIKKEEIPLFFERFYRGSDSRAQTNGAGLGLAILKLLADKNKWELDVDISQNNVIFSIIF